MWSVQLYFHGEMYAWFVLGGATSRLLPAGLLERWTLWTTQVTDAAPQDDKYFSIRFVVIVALLAKLPLYFTPRSSITLQESTSSSSH